VSTTSQRSAPHRPRVGAAAKRARAQVGALLGAALLDHPWLRRLEGISFLGTLDTHPGSRRASNRFEHSMGVAGLAAQAAEALELEHAQARTFVAACLLHDVGHYPLSHAAERAFAERLGADHHQVGRWIILGEGPVDPGRSLCPLLERIGIDPAQVWAIIDRSAGLSPALAPLAELLRAPINLDTLEGIDRVARDFRIPRRPLPPRIFTWVEGELGISREALPAVDRFWRLKHRVYDRVINLPSNILAEARLSELVAAHIDEGVLPNLREFDDQALRRRVGEAAFCAAQLRSRDDQDYALWLSEDYGEVVARSESQARRDPLDGPSPDTPRPLMVRVRKRYYVDRSVEASGAGLPLHLWSTRYRHEKRRAWLVPRPRDQLDLPLPAPLPRPPGSTDDTHDTHEHGELPFAGPRSEAPEI